MNVSVLIGTYGDQAWADLAWSRAYPSAIADEPHQVGLEHQPEGTLAAIRNSLAEAAEGDWLCFLDADDELAPSYLAAMERCETEQIRGQGIFPDCLLVPRVQYVYLQEGTYERREGQPGVVPVGHEDAPVFPNEGHWPEMNTAVIGTLIPAALFDLVGGFREGEYEDYDLWLRCERAGAHQIRVPDAVYRAYVSREGRNANPETRRLRTQAHIRLLREHRDWMKAKA